MQVGVGSYAYAWAIGVPGYLPAKPMITEDFLRRTCELGGRVAQVCDNLPLHSLTPRERAALAELAEGLDISVEVGTRGIKPERLREYLQIAETFRSPILRTVIDSPGHQPQPEEVVAILQKVLPEFAAAGVTLAIENHDRFRVAQLDGILCKLDSPFVGVCLDTVNSFGALEGPEAVVGRLARWTVSLHVKDFSIRRAGHNMGFVLEGTPAGQGGLDVPAILEKLHQAGRDPNAILELWPAPEEDIEATIAKEDGWARQSMAYLRTVITD